MGLRLSARTYNWNADMSIINKGAEYTNHMLKNQTNKMEWCIKNLKAQFEKSSTNGGYPKELAILSNSVVALKTYADKIIKHSGNINLLKESHNLKKLLESSLPFSSKARITVEICIPDNVYWVCDKNHMTEVFTNIILNGMEASGDT